MISPIKVSAPGKLMLLGEHAVVYGYSCLATSVGERMHVTLEMLEETILQLDAPDVGISNYTKKIESLGQGEIPKAVKFVEIAVKNFREKYPFKFGVKISTRSNFSQKYGFGSSSAVTVGVVSGLLQLLSNQSVMLNSFQHPSNQQSKEILKSMPKGRITLRRSQVQDDNMDSKELKKTIFDLAYKTVLEIQGKASGFDVAAAIWGGTLYFVGGGKVIEPLATQQLPLIIGYSGEKGDTVSLVQQVAEKYQKNPHSVGKIFTAISELVEKSKVALLENDWESLGKYMNFNQDYLRDLGVSTQKLEDMVLGAKDAGAWGAKLSGAGGGDCMIALTREDKREAVKEAITKAGGETVEVETGVEGVRIEK